MKPRIVFFGSSKFVIPIIENLQKNFDLALVITTEKLPTDPVLSYCNQSKVHCYVAQDFRNKKTMQDITKINAALGVLASFGAIIPKEILNIFPYGIINIHPSLLPAYRGPTPVQTAILNGNKISGYTIIKLDEHVDHGPILMQEKETILENDTAESLYERLFRQAAGSIVHTIELYLEGKITPQEQNHAKATFTKSLIRSDGYIDISYNDTSFSSEKIQQMIRAYYPWPGVYTKLKMNLQSSQKEELKIIKFLPENKIQVEGKKPMSYKDFVNGYGQKASELLQKLHLL